MPAPKREQSHKSDLVRIIRHYAYAYGYNLEKVAVLSGIGVRTMYARMKNPGAFSLDEINRIARVLKIPAKDLSPILAWGYAS